MGTDPNRSQALGRTGAGPDAAAGRRNRDVFDVMRTAVVAAIVEGGALYPEQETGPLATREKKNETQTRGQEAAFQQSGMVR